MSGIQRYDVVWRDEGYVKLKDVEGRYVTYKDHLDSLKPAKKFCELLERIDNRAMASDGPVAPTLFEATASELRQMYLLADKIRKAV